MTAAEKSWPKKNGQRMPRKGLPAKDRAREKAVGIITSNGTVDMAQQRKLQAARLSIQKKLREKS